jgi:hypothetical protein
MGEMSGRSARPHNIHRDANMLHFFAAFASLWTARTLRRPAGARCRRISGRADANGRAASVSIALLEMPL